MTKEIKHTWFYPHAPEKVWDYLTQPELIAHWLMPTDFKPEVGYDFKFTTRPMPNFGFDGIVYCKVLELEPHKKLTYTWKGGPGDGSINLDSIVYWTLVEKDNGTELLLRHSGFNETENSLMYSIMNDGWYKNIQKIGELITNAQTQHDTTQA